MQIAQTLNNLVAERTTNGLTVELSVKLSYASCMCAQEENSHRDFTQQFLTGVTVIPQSTVNT